MMNCSRIVDDNLLGSVGIQQASFRMEDDRSLYGEINWSTVSCAFKTGLYETVLSVCSLFISSKRPVLSLYLPFELGSFRLCVSEESG